MEHTTDTHDMDEAQNIIMSKKARHNREHAGWFIKSRRGKFNL